MAMNWSNIGEGIITGGASGAVNGLLGLAGARVQYKNQKRLMKLQNQYAIDAFNRENERQDYLLANQASIYKNSLQRAGLSTALAGIDGGAGGMPAATNMEAPSTPTAPLPDFGKIDLMQARLIAAQAENIEADTQKKIKETEGQDIQNWLNQTYGAEQWQAAIKNLDADTANKIEQAAYTNAKKVNETNLTEAEINQIEKHLDWDYQKLNPELKLLAAQAHQATASGDLSHAQISEVWQSIKESGQRIENLQRELGLTDAQISVATNLAENYAKEHEILGYDVTSAKVKAQMGQFERDLQKSMGLRFYRAKQVAETVLPIGATAAVLGKAFGLGK